MIEKIYARPAGYELVEFLGEGLNSCVYRAIKEDSASGVRFQVALKILKSEKLVELWRAEFDRLSTVRSKNCVSLLGWEFICNKPALVLEYVRGATLAELSEHSLLSPALLTEIIAQSLQGLRDLKSARVFHGDLNLYNIMVNDQGVVKLVDFGVIETDQKIMTTPEFASPEVMCGATPNYQTDVYSLNAILQEVSRRHNFVISTKIEKFAASEGVRRELAACVQKFIQLRTSLAGRTRSLERIKKREWTRGRALQAVIVLSLCVVSLASMGDQPQQRLDPHQNLVHITIRTTKWLHLKIDGKDMGFSPVDSWVEHRAKIDLLWEGSDRTGRTTLTPSPGQHIVLTDRDFEKSSYKE